MSLTRIAMSFCRSRGLLVSRSVDPVFVSRMYKLLKRPPRQEPNTIRRASGVHTGYQSVALANVIRVASDQARVGSQR